MEYGGEFVQHQKTWYFVNQKWENGEWKINPMAHLGLVFLDKFFQVSLIDV